MSQYLPEVAWSTIASNVTLGASAYRYYITVNPLDPNEAGASPMTVAINDWFIDFAGYPFLIEEVNGGILTVYDILERGDGITSAYAPYANKLGYVYRPLNGAIILTQAQLRKLDQSAKDIIQPIEKGIQWAYRGIRLVSVDDDYSNITRLDLTNNLKYTYTENGGWQGGHKAELDLNIGLGTGALAEMEYTNNGDGTITVQNNTFMMYDNVSGIGYPKPYLISGGTFSFTDNVYNYIVADYNSGTPTMYVITDVTLINETTIIPVFSVLRRGTILCLTNWDTLGNAKLDKLHQSIVKTQRYRRQSGLAISVPSTGTPRRVSITGGIVWIGAVSVELNTTVSGDAGVYMFEYYKSSGTWTYTLASQINNTYYQGTTDRVELTANRYAVAFIFRGVEHYNNHIYLVYGTGDYTLAQAQAASVPSDLPIAIRSHTILVGRVIIQKSSDTITELASAFDTVFVTQQYATNHNDLPNLNVGDYMHLTALEYSGLTYGNVTTLHNHNLVGLGDVYGTPSDQYSPYWVAANNRFEFIRLQPYDNTLTSLASISGVQGDIIYASGTDTWTKLAKSTGTNYYLKNSGTSNNPAWSTIGDADLTLADVTTNNSSASKHGFLKKLNNLSNYYMNGQGNWDVPEGRYFTTSDYYTDRYDFITTSNGIILGDDYINQFGLGTLAQLVINSSTSAAEIMLRGKQVLGYGWNIGTGCTTGSVPTDNIYIRPRSTSNGIYITPDGYLGINVVSPTYAFDLNGTARIGTLNGLIKGTSGILSAITSTESGTKYLRDDYTWQTVTEGYWSQNGTSIYYNTGNVGIGTTSPGAKLDIAGTFLVNRDAVAYYYNLIHKYGGPSKTGTLKITLPKGWSSTMMKIKIEGFEYSGVARGNSWSVNVGGYNYLTTPAWCNYFAEINGAAKFSNVRLGYDGTRNVILLGTTTSTWSYSNIAVTEMLASYSNTTGWDTGWSIDWITDETGITNIATPAIDLFRDSSGNIGINNTTPSYKLDVNGTGNFATSLKVGTLSGLIKGTGGVLSGLSGTGFVKSSGTTITFDNSTYQPSDATLTSLAAIAGVQGDLLYASGTDTWTRLAKSTTANSFLKNSGTNNNPVWSTISTSEVSEGTNLYFTNARAIGSLLTGYTATSGTISATNSILQAIQKLGYDKHVAVTLAANNGLSLTGQVLAMGTPSTITSSSTNSVTTSTHTHAITAGLGFIGNGSAQYQVPVTGATPFTPTWTTATKIFGTTGLNSLTYASTAFVKMTGTNTFSLDTNTYLTANQTITLSGAVTGSGTTAITTSLATPATITGSTTNTGGTGAHTHAISLSFDNLTDVVLTTPTQGSVLYFNGTNWVNLAPGTNGYFLKTQGVGANPVWASVSGGTVTSVAAGNGMNFTTINSSGSVTLGTPSALTSITTNSVTSNSHTHSIEIAHQASTTSSSTPTPTGNYKENEYYLTALAAGATFAAPSGTPVNGNTLLIRIKDNGTARTLAWNSIYRAIGVTLPTTTTASKTLYIGCIYNSTDSKWDVVSVVEQT